MDNRKYDSFDYNRSRSGQSADESHIFAYESGDLMRSRLPDYPHPSYLSSTQLGGGDTSTATAYTSLSMLQQMQEQTDQYSARFKFGKSTATANDSRVDSSKIHPGYNRIGGQNVSQPGETPVTGLTIYNSRAVASNSWLKLVDILTQNVIVHPLIALRRTCQRQKQGFFPLYKGLSSELTTKALMAGTEAAISNYTGWPMEFTKRDFIDNSFKHLALKGLTLTIVTPFLCSSAIQTVQSAIVVKDKTAFVECLREGFFRLLHFRYSSATRLLPIWILVGPTLLYHVSHLLIYTISKKIISFGKRLIVRTWLTPRRRSLYDDDMSILDDTASSNAINDTKILELNEIDSDSSEISTNLTANLIADIALFPIETAMHSLYLQGSRTLVDNCDETTVVLPVITNYDGFADCFQSIMKTEGALGLYKGLGGLCLQFTLHYLIIRLTHYAIREFSDSRNRKTKKSNQRMDRINRTQQSNYSVDPRGDDKNLRFDAPSSQNIVTPTRRR